MTRMELLYLTADDVTELLDMPGALSVVEEAFREHGMEQVQMPAKSYLYFPTGDLRTMPAYLKSAGIAGVKIVNVHPGNPAKGLPTVMAVVVLNSIETGAPLAMMDGTYLTDMRTGAAGGVAADRLARRDATVVGMIGAGRQAMTQLQAISIVRDIDAVKVVDVSAATCDRFKKKMAELGCDIVIAGSVQETCDCDILVTTTPVRAPIVADGWVREGTHINAIGADATGKEELDPQILKRSTIVIDDYAQATHSGEINVPLNDGVITVDDIYGTLGEVVAGIKPGRTSDSEITVFDSTGLAIQDVSTAHHVYRQAVERGIGARLKLF
uniref:Alanine dehydrogenase n=1 Tax=Candidatus Methanogaster sp. ANME-2c ERB4 TaxID=2759911 RepID=A0A7G9YHD4_9EURY|nr:alanine dehydrogenase [Methanosarcinales archaeon ANME-2c ERB4]